MYLWFKGLELTSILLSVLGGDFSLSLVLVPCFFIAKSADTLRTITKDVRITYNVESSQVNWVLSKIFTKIMRLHWFKRVLYLVYTCIYTRIWIQFYIFWLFLLSRHVEIESVSYIVGGTKVQYVIWCRLALSLSVTLI